MANSEIRPRHDPTPLPALTCNRLAWYVGAAAFALYWLTCAPGVLWQDSAMFQFRVWHGDTAGIQGLPLAHPLYILLAKLFAWLPVGPFAFRVNLFSGLCAAGALGFLTSLVFKMTRSASAAVCGAILLGASHTFWMHAVIAEVYSLYALGLAVELWLLERFFSTRKSGWLIAALFVNGLNLSNHLLAILHWPAYAIVVAWALRAKVIKAGTLLTLILAVLIGSSHYLALIVAEIARGRPAGTVLKESLVGPPNRAGVVLTHSFSVPHLISRSIQYFALNFPTPLILLAPVGLWVSVKKRESRFLAAFAAVTFVVGFAFAFRYLVPDQFVFFYPCYVILALFAALGVPIFARSRAGLVACVALALLPAGLYEIAPKIARERGFSLGLQREIPYRDGYSYFLLPRKNGYDGAERFAKEALQTASPDGALLGDSTILNAVAYVRDVQGFGTDVALNAGDIQPAPPRIRGDDESLRPFIARKAAYQCTNVAAYLSKHFLDKYDLVPAGVIYRIVDKKTAREAR